MDGLPPPELRHELQGISLEKGVAKKIDKPVELTLAKRETLFALPNKDEASNQPTSIIVARKVSYPDNQQGGHWEVNTFQGGKKDVISIGRSPASDIPYQFDGTVSELHAVITRGETGYSITDRSTNGTKIEEMVTPNGLIPKGRYVLVPIERGYKVTYTEKGKSYTGVVSKVGEDIVINFGGNQPVVLLKNQESHPIHNKISAVNLDSRWLLLQHDLSGGFQSLAVNAPKEQATLSQSDGERPLEERLRQQRELVSQALRLGNSVMQTWTWDPESISGHRGFQFVGESHDKLRAKYGEPINLHLGAKFADPLYDAFGFEPSTAPLSSRRQSYWGNKFDRNEFLATEGIYEIVVIAPATKDVMRQKPATMADLVEGGSAERAFILNYHASDRYNGSCGTGRYKDRDMYYKDGVGRPGNFLNIQFVLPWNMGQQISQAIQEDPTFIRKLTEAYVQQRYSQGFNKDVWQVHGRPPYDRWDKYPEDRMCFVDRVQEPTTTLSDMRAVESHVIEFKPVGSISDPNNYHSNVVKKS